MVSAAEKQKINEAVVALLAEKDASRGAGPSKPSGSDSKKESSGLGEFFKPTAHPLKARGPSFTHGLKWHFACLFDEEIVRWGTEDSSEEADIRLEQCSG